MIRRAALSLLIGAGLALGACGLRPLYDNDMAAPAAQTLALVTISPIEGRAGWLVRNAIVDRIGDHGGEARYRLDIRLDDRIEGYGLRADTSTTRERRILRARYQLVDAASGATLIDATAGSDMGIDVVNSEYATIAAEQTALERLSERIADQIVTRIAIEGRKSGTPGTRP